MTIPRPRLNFRLCEFIWNIEIFANVKVLKCKIKQQHYQSDQVEKEEGKINKVLRKIKTK
jgi:hypothetical protein